MQFDVSVAMTWLLFIALFPITYFWARSAWRILRHKDFTAVALKHGTPPPRQAKFAPWAVAINLAGVASLLWVITGILFGALTYETWSAVAGSTIWLKIIFDFILSRHAHFSSARKPRESC